MGGSDEWGEYRAPLSLAQPAIAAGFQGKLLDLGNVVDNFHTALFFTLKQTHCAFVACDSK